MRRILATSVIGLASLAMAGCSDERTTIPVQTVGACHEGDVVLVAGRHGAAAGSSVLTFTATRVSGVPCLVKKWPGVVIRDADGFAIAKERGDEVAGWTLLSTALEFHLGWASACDPLPDGPMTAGVGLLGAEDVALELPPDFGPTGCMGGPMNVWVEPAFD